MLLFTTQMLRTLMMNRKGIEVGRFVMILVFLIPVLILAVAVLAGVITIGTEGVPFARALLITIVCAISGTG